MTPTPKAPCGQPATIAHFKECHHPGCKAKFADFQRAKAEIASGIQKYLKPTKELV